MTSSCNFIVDRKDHVQYLTVSKSYSDNCTCSLTEQNIALNNLYHCQMILYMGHYMLIQIYNKTILKIATRFC